MALHKRSQGHVNYWSVCLISGKFPGYSIEERRNAGLVRSWVNVIISRKSAPSILVKCFLVLITVCTKPQTFVCFPQQEDDHKLGAWQCLAVSVWLWPLVTWWALQQHCCFSCVCVWACVCVVGSACLSAFVWVDTVGCGQIGWIVAELLRAGTHRFLWTSQVFVVLSRVRLI